MKRPLWTRADLLLAVALVGASLFVPRLFLSTDQPAWVEIHSENQTRQHSLAPNRVVEANGPLGVTRVEISEGTAQVISSPCPLQLCVRAGRLERTGQLAVCVPNRVSVKLAGGTQEATGGVDAVSR